MRFVVVADIHANLPAFQAVLSDAERRGAVDELCCLGDVVGYGPWPHECLEILRRYPHTCVAGNHDWGATGKIDISGFNADALAACRWTGEVLSAQDRDYLDNLPLVVEKGDFMLVHGSPKDPLREYLISLSCAEQNFACFTSRFCLVGHSHLPLVFTCSERHGISCRYPAPVTRLSSGGSRLIINPGSVGQPRDGDPRASYAIYDNETEELEHYRVPYDIVRTQEKMMACNLPPRLAARLTHGT
ncbi:MAG: metallophosphoesterase family protein [Chloroflexota bacterium]